MRKLFQTECPAVPFALLCTILLCSACTDNTYSSPRGYELHKPVQRELGKSLNEISGICFVPGDDALLAVSDSKRDIVRIDLRRQKLTDKVKNFYQQEDFEDVAKVGNSVFVLVSNGNIVEIPLDRPDSINVYPLNLSGKNDFESLYFDPVAKGLVALCKNCEADKEKDVHSAFLFRLPARQYDPEPWYAISNAQVKKLLRNDDAEFKPSAASIHPADGRLYILGSAGQLLVIADRRGNVAEVYRLNPDHHPQAEGIAFAPNGAMYISNEGKFGTPTLKMYSYKKSLQRQVVKNR